MYIIDGIAYAGESTGTIKVVDVKVVETLCLLLTFSTGEKRVFDAEPLLQYPVYAPLRDPAFFRDVQIDGATLYKNSFPYEDQVYA